MISGDAAIEYIEERVKRDGGRNQSSFLRWRMRTAIEVEGGEMRSASKVVYT